MNPSPSSPDRPPGGAAPVPVPNANEPRADKPGSDKPKGPPRGEGPPAKYREPTKSELQRYYHSKQGEIESEKMRLEYGWLARIIGRESASYNIAFVIVTALLVTGVVVIFTNPNGYIEFWKIMLPILTLTLGYLFGKNSKD